MLKDSGSFSDTPPQPTSLVSRMHEAIQFRQFGFSWQWALGLIPVLFMVGVSLWIFLTFLLKVCIPLTSAAQVVFYLLFFNSLFILYAVCYFKCITTHPGTIPVGFEYKEFFEVETTLSGDRIEELKRDAGKRLCHVCRKIKPDRTYHCNRCGKCVLKMDSHCLWINNCVGFHNQKYFLLWILYAACICIYVALCTIPVFVDFREQTELSSEATEVMCLLFVTSSLGVGALFFAGSHIHMLLFNQTTMESLELPRITKGGRESISNPFDLNDYRTNVEQVFGDVVWAWFLPFETTPGNGTVFPVSKHADETLGYAHST